MRTMLRRRWTAFSGSYRQVQCVSAGKSPLRLRAPRQGADGQVHPQTGGARLCQGLLPADLGGCHHLCLLSQASPMGEMHSVNRVGPRGRGTGHGTTSVCLWSSAPRDVCIPSSPCGPDCSYSRPGPRQGLLSGVGELEGGSPGLHLSLCLLP